MIKSNLAILSTMLISTLMFVSSCSEDEPGEPEADCTQLEGSFSVISEPTCSEGATILLSGNGGLEPYMFSIDGINFSTSGSFENLSAGTYTGAVRDENGCEDSGSFTIDPAEGAISVATSADEISGCGSANGQVTVTATGGVGALMYRLVGGTFGSENVFTGLTAGDHEFEVMDEDGCVSSRTESVLSGTSYANAIAPILEANCDGSSCHIGGSSLPDWSDLSVVQAHAESIKTRTANGSMPRDSRELTQEEIDLIACWVDDGALAN